MIDFYRRQKPMGPVDFVLEMKEVEAPYRASGPQHPERLKVLRALHPDKFRDGTRLKALMAAPPQFVRPHTSERKTGVVLSADDVNLMRARTSVVEALRPLPPSEFARRIYFGRGFSDHDLAEDIQQGHVCDLTVARAHSGDSVVPGAGGFLKSGSRIEPSYPTHPLCFVTRLHLPGDVEFVVDAVCRGIGDRQPKALRVAKPEGVKLANLPWGLNREEARHRCAGKLAYLAESPFDAIAMRHITKAFHVLDCCYYEALGTPLPSWLIADPVALGAFSCTAISHEFFESIADVSRLVIAFDADDAGKHGAEVAARMAREVGICNVEIQSHFGGEKDPNDQWLKMIGRKK